MEFGQVSKMKRIRELQDQGVGSEGEGVEDACKRVGCECLQNYEEILRK